MLYMCGPRYDFGQKIRIVIPRNECSQFGSLGQINPKDQPPPYETSFQSILKFSLRGNANKNQFKNPHGTLYSTI